MSYLKFDKEQLTNLQYSLNREILRSNRTGTYMSTTLNGCNTRKYHGLLICPLSDFGEEKHVLLSSLDVTVIHQEIEFQLGIHRYQGGIYEPNGHKYIQNIEFGQIPRITYRIGGILLSVELMLSESRKQVLIRYVLDEAPEQVNIRFRPYLAFRNMHSLSKANMWVNSKYHSVRNGISMRLYDGYPDLYMQFSKAGEFIPAPDWYYNIEYIKELNRGYEYLEDLFVPGYFDLIMKPGESVVFAAGLDEAAPMALKQAFTRGLKKANQRYTFLQSLRNAAEQFIQQKRDDTTIIAGFPWYENISRQVFIALPGLAQATGIPTLCTEVLSTYKKYLRNGLFPDNIFSQTESYTSADAPLWYIWTLQKLAGSKHPPKDIWLRYGGTVKAILEAYRNSIQEFIRMNDDYLIEAVKPDTALTWMDSYVKGVPVTQRQGMAVEINALWYNAVVFALTLSNQAGDTAFWTDWEGMPETIGKSFLKTFCKAGHDHLADVVYNGAADMSIRPNMVIAASLPFSPLSKEQKKQILSISRQHLLTSRGLRTLSPDHLRYMGVVEGGPDQRDAAIHQGAVWPWLIQFFTEAYLQIHGRGGLPFIKNHLAMFEEAIAEHCVGTLSEVYNGDPPHKGKGAISQAVNVAAIFYANRLMNKYKPLHE